MLRKIEILYLKLVNHKVRVVASSFSRMTRTLLLRQWQIVIYLLLRIFFHPILRQFQLDPVLFSQEFMVFIQLRWRMLNLSISFLWEIPKSQMISILLMSLTSKVIFKKINYFIGSKVNREVKEKGLKPTATLKDENLLAIKN